MSIRAYRLHSLHSNISRKETIEFVDKVPTINITLGIEMGNHLLGMHTRIGAPGANNGSINTKQGTKSLGKGLLY
jgi:hypothetical protein